MEMLIVIGLLGMGVFLIVAEVIFIPGTTIFGILGIICLIAGVIASFSYFGDTTGSIILTGSVLSIIGLIIWSLQSKTWEKFSLKGELKGRVNEGRNDNIKIDDEGIAVSYLRPSGKAEINDQVYEVHSLGGYIPAKSKIKVVEVGKNKIFVEQIN